MAIELHRLTREYLWWEIETPNNLATSSVEIAFEPPETPLPSVWASSTLVEEEGTWYLRELISGEGQGGDTELAAGDHEAWARLTDSPERPVRKLGVVTIL